jgi:hypothetical protein
MGTSRKSAPFLFLLITTTLDAQRGFEVWMTDQNNTAGYSAAAPRGTHGGRLLIYRDEDLESPGGPVNRPTIIDMAEMFALEGPNNTTGANVVRPHMIFQSPTHGYMALAFVVSGHVAIINGATKRPKALFRMSAGAGGARQAHAAFWTQDGSMLLVANQNGKLLEKIVYDPGADTFTHDTSATLNLATCRTPNGFPCETQTPVNESDPAYFGPHNRPDNAPICPITSFNDKVFVTLRGGGMFVVDPLARPMSIVAEYGNQFFGRDGCGGVQAGKYMYLKSGAGTAVTNESQFIIYRARDEYPSAPDYVAPNSPLLRFFEGDGSDGRDAHGMGLSPGGHYLWVFDRGTDVAEVYRVPLGQPAVSVNLRLSGVSRKPTPDLAALSPLGNRFFLSLRGPKPQTGGAHVATGETPGLGILQLSQGGAWGTLTHVLPASLRNPVDQSEESDPHGIGIRVW